LLIHWMNYKLCCKEVVLQLCAGNSSFMVLCTVLCVVTDSRTRQLALESTLRSRSAQFEHLMELQDPNSRIHELT
jgi:hypothetical protein